MQAIIRKVPDMDYELIAYGGICFNDNHRCNLPHGLREIVRDSEGEEMAGSRLRTRESTYCQLRMMITNNGGNVVKRGRLMCYPVIDISPTLPVFMRMGINHFKIAGRERTPDFCENCGEGAEEWDRESEGVWKFSSGKFRLPDWNLELRI